MKDDTSLHSFMYQQINSCVNIDLRLLGVDRSHTRRGIGSLLLADGLAHADRLGANIFLMSTTAGMPVYLRQGWDR